MLKNETKNLLSIFFIHLGWQYYPKMTLQYVNKKNVDNLCFPYYN